MSCLAVTGVSTLPVVTPGGQGDARVASAGTLVFRTLALALPVGPDTVLTTTPVVTGVVVVFALKAALKLVVLTAS